MWKDELKGSKPLKSIAFHEAGHAVIAYRLGCPLRSVSIIPGEDYNGLTRKGSLLPKIECGVLDTYSDEKAVEKEIMILLAGGVAQRKFAPQDYQEAHDADDRKKAYDLVANIAGSLEDIFAKYNELLEKAQKMMQKKRVWWEVTAIATALLEQGRLCAHQAEEIIQSHCGKEDRR